METNVYIYFLMFENDIVIFFYLPKINDHVRVIVLYDEEAYNSEWLQKEDELPDVNESFLVV